MEQIANAFVVCPGRINFVPLCKYSLLFSYDGISIVFFQLYCPLVQEESDKWNTVGYVTEIICADAANSVVCALWDAIRESGHGQQSVVSLASLATQLPAHRAGLSPPGLPREENNARAPSYLALPTVLEIRELT